MQVEITGKLKKIQLELKVKKSNYNNFQKYNYRSCEDILEAVKFVLKNKEGIIFVSDEIVNIGDRFYVKATATFTDGKNKINCYGFAREATEKKGMDLSQLTGSCSSYARKYALCGLLCIDDGKDSDSANNNTHGNTETKKPIPEVSVELVNKIKTFDDIEKLKSFCKEQVSKLGEEYKPKITILFREQKSEIEKLDENTGTTYGEHSEDMKRD